MTTAVNLTLYSLFTSIILFDGFFSEGNAGTGLHLFPKKLSYTTEFLSFLILGYFFLILSFRKKISIKTSYVVLLIVLLAHMIIGLILNEVPSGAIFSGIRRYFAYMPLFFLPMVYKFSDREVLNQLKFLLIIGLVHFPLAIIQRFYLFKNYYTGDFVTGTLSTSSIMSIFQICCIVVQTGFYLKNCIKLKTYLFSTLILFIPTVINETKGTIVLLVIALLILIILNIGKNISYKRLLFFLLLALTLIFVFIIAYNFIYNRTNIANFFMGKGSKTHSFKGYLYTGLTEEELENKDPGRIDALVFPFKILSNEPLKILIGLGIGNVNPSGIAKFEGKYTTYEKYGVNIITAASLIWEIGLIGLCLNFIFLWIIFKDSIKISRFNDSIGFFAIGWTAVVVIIALSFFYKNVFHLKIITYIFWYFSGIIAAKSADQS